MILFLGVKIFIILANVAFLDTLLVAIACIETLHNSKPKNEICVFCDLNTHYPSDLYFGCYTIAQLTHSQRQSPLCCDIVIVILLNLYRFLMKSCVKKLLSQLQFTIHSCHTDQYCLQQGHSYVAYAVHDVLMFTARLSGCWHSQGPDGNCGESAAGWLNQIYHKLCILYRSLMQLRMSSLSLTTFTVVAW
jgi:hypothetical protein